MAGAIGATSGAVSARADCGARQAEEMSFSATGIRSITRQRPKNTSRRHGMARARGVRRLAEALRTLLYMPMNGYPAGFTNSWPTILHNARIAPGMRTIRPGRRSVPPSRIGPSRDRHRSRSRRSRRWEPRSSGRRATSVMSRNCFAGSKPSGSHVHATATSRMLRAGSGFLPARAAME